MKAGKFLASKNTAAYISLVCAVLALAILAFYCVYAQINDYYDSVVCGCFILSAVCFLGYFLFNRIKALRFLNILAVFFLSFALCFFFLNSYPVWADELNGITMYNSRGGLVPVIGIMAATLICTVAGIVTCFMKPETKEERQ